MVTFLLKQSIYSQSKDTLKVQSDYNIIHYFKQKKKNENVCGYKHCNYRQLNASITHCKHTAYSSIISVKSFMRVVTELFNWAPSASEESDIIRSKSSKMRTEGAWTKASETECVMACWIVWLLSRASFEQLTKTLQVKTSISHQKKNYYHFEMKSIRLKFISKQTNVNNRKNKA